MSTPIQQARARLLETRRRHLGLRVLAEWRAQETSARKEVIGELELAQSDQRPHREAFLAALDLLEVAAEKDSLEQPDSLLSDLEWLMAELDARLKNAP